MKTIITNVTVFMLSFNVDVSQQKHGTLHERNLQLLATEISHVKNGITPKLMGDIFQFFKKPYILRNIRMKLVYNVRLSLFTCSKICELIPSFLKEETSLAFFKKKIKTWTTNQCPCRLCQKYIGKIGFIYDCPVMVNFVILVLLILDILFYMYFQIYLALHFRVCFTCLLVWL